MFASPASHLPFCYMHTVQFRHLLHRRYHRRPTAMGTNRWFVNVVIYPWWGCIWSLDTGNEPMHQDISHVFFWRWEDVGIYATTRDSYRFHEFYGVTARFSIDTDPRLLVMSLIHAWRPHLPRCQQDLCPRSAWKVGKQGGNAYGESQGCAECWPLSSKIFGTLTPSAPVKTWRYRAENSSQTPKKRQINNIYEIMWVFGQAPAVADEYDPFAEGFQSNGLICWAHLTHERRCQAWTFLNERRTLCALLFRAETRGQLVV